MFICFLKQNIIKGNASFFIKIFDLEGFGSQKFLLWDKCPNRKFEEKQEKGQEEDKDKEQDRD